MSAVILAASIVTLFSFWVGLLKHRIGTLRRQTLESRVAVEPQHGVRGAAVKGLRSVPVGPVLAHSAHRENGVLTWSIDTD